MISRKDWLSNKERELRERVEALEKNASYGYLSDLFSLALFAKTNKLSKEGTRFLDNAFASKDFTWLLERADRIEGCVVTHAHEEHIGGCPTWCDLLPARVSRCRSMARRSRWEWCGAS
mgnify:CR=1 FL=1